MEMAEAMGIDPKVDDTVVACTQSCLVTILVYISLYRPTDTYLLYHQIKRSALVIFATLFVHVLKC